MFLNLLLSILAIYASTHVYAQKVTKATQPSGIILGMHTAGSSFKSYVVDEQLNVKPFYRNIVFEPYLAYNFDSILCVGAVANFQIIRSNYKPEHNLMEVGGFLRYYIPIQFNVKFFRRISFYAEGSVRVANYQQYNRSEFFEDIRFHFMLYTFNPIGLNFKIWKGLQVDLAPEVFIRNSGYTRWGARIGLEYHLSNTVWKRK